MTVQTNFIMMVVMMSVVWFSISALISLTLTKEMSHAIILDTVIEYNKIDIYFLFFVNLFFWPVTTILVYINKKINNTTPIFSITGFAKWLKKQFLYLDFGQNISNILPGNDASEETHAELKSKFVSVSKLKQWRKAVLRAEELGFDPELCKETADQITDLIHLVEQFEDEGL